MKKSLLIAMFLMIKTMAFSQNLDTLMLFNEAKQLVINKKATTNSVLINSKYLSLHEYMPFHNLIMDYATENNTNIAWKGLKGKSLKVKMTFLNKKGQPMQNEKIYYFQTDSKGYYLTDTTYNPTKGPGEERARIFGYAVTSKKGQIIINTIRPGSYPVKILDVILAPHFHLEFSPFKSKKFPNGKARNYTANFVDNPKFGFDSDFQKKWRELGTNFDGTWIHFPQDTENPERKSCEMLAIPVQKKGYQYLDLTIKLDE